VEDVWEAPGGDGGVEECPPDRIIVDPSRGVRICKDSGYVIDEGIIDGSPEWRRFSNNDVKGLVRAGHTLTYARHDGMNPGVVYKPKGKAWRDHSLRYRRLTGRYERVRMLRSSVKRSDRPIIDMLMKSQELARAVGINQRHVIETAGWVIHKYYAARRKEGEAQKRPIVINEREKWAVAVVALKKAIQAYNLPTAENELYQALAELTDPQTAENVKNYSWKILVKMNNYGIKVKPNRPGMRPSMLPAGRRGNGRISLENQRALTRITPYVRRLVQELGLPPYLAEKAVKFVQSVVSAHPGKSLSGRKPEAIAAAAVYFIARIFDYNEITQARVAEVFGLSEANVRKALRYLLRDVVVLVGV